MIRVGIIGTDSSHAVEFTKLLNSGRFATKVVGACAGALTDFPLSVSRREKITDTLTRELAVPLVSSAQELLREVDAVMLLSCDGRRHLEEVSPLLAARKPIFVDKPLATDAKSAKEILRAAAHAHCPLFSSSALRYRVQPRLANRPSPIQVEVTAPLRAEIGHADLAWYGIHSVESAYAVLGAGCRTVQRQVNASRDVTVGMWEDGSTLTVSREVDFDGAFALKAVQGSHTHTASGFSYGDLMSVLVEFFRTGQSPVDPAETAEIFAFISAADLSRDLNGQRVELAGLG